VLEEENRRISSVHGAIDCYDKVLKLMNKGYSRHAALAILGKGLNTFRRIRHIYELKVTRPETYKEVSCLIFSTAA
jgi:hypothetical protein